MKPIAIGYVVAVLVACAIALIEYRNFTGFCYAEKRYLSDLELINTAIRRAIDFSDHVTSEVKNRKVYRSVEEFHDINPDCCILHKWGHPDLEDGIWVRSFGWYISVAEVMYRLDTVSDKLFHSYVFMSACGQVRGIEGAVEVARVPVKSP